MVSLDQSHADFLTEILETVCSDTANTAVPVADAATSDVSLTIQPLPADVRISYTDLSKATNDCFEESSLVIDTTIQTHPSTIINGGITSMDVKTDWSFLCKELNAQYEPIFYPFSIHGEDMSRLAKCAWKDWRDFCKKQLDVHQLFSALRDHFAAQLKIVACSDGKNVFDYLSSTTVDAFLSRWEKAKMKSYAERCEEMNGVDRPEYNHRGEEFSISSFSAKLSTTVDKMFVNESGLCGKYSDVIRDYLREHVSECQNMGRHRQRNNLPGLFYLLFQCFNRDMNNAVFALTYAMLNIDGVVGAIYSYEVARYILMAYTAPIITDHGHTPAHMCVMSGDAPAMFLDFERNDFWKVDSWGLLPFEAALLNLIVEQSVDHVMVFVMTCHRSGLLSCLITPPDWEECLTLRVRLVQRVCETLMLTGALCICDDLLGRFAGFREVAHMLPNEPCVMVLKDSMSKMCLAMEISWTNRFEKNFDTSMQLALSTQQQEKISIIQNYKTAHFLPAAAEAVRHVHSTFLRSQIPCQIETIVGGRQFTYVFADSPRYAQFSAMSGAFATLFENVAVTSPDVLTTPAALYSYLIYTNHKNGRCLLEAVQLMEDGIKSFAGNRVRHTKRSATDDGEVFWTGEKRRKVLQARLDRLGSE